MRRARRKPKTPNWLQQNWKGFLALGIVTGVRNFFFTRGVSWASTKIPGLNALVGEEEAKKLD